MCIIAFDFFEIIKERLLHSFVGVEAEAKKNDLLMAIYNGTDESKIFRS